MKIKLMTIIKMLAFAYLFNIIILKRGSHMKVNIKDVLKELEKNLQKDWKYSGIMSYNK